MIGAFALLSLAILLFTGKPSSTITMRHLQTVQSNDVFLLTFEITNHTSDDYIFLPFEVAAQCAGVWQRCFQFRNDRVRRPERSLLPQASLTYSCNATNLSPGCALRFKIRAQKTLTGVEGFVRRIRLSANPHMRDPHGSFHPFAKNSKVFGEPIEIASEEFTLPSLPASAEPEPSAPSPGSK